MNFMKSYIIASDLWVGIDHVYNVSYVFTQI